MKRPAGAIALLLTAALAFAGAAKEPQTAASGPIEITVPAYQAGQNVGAKYFLPMVERFNARHAGVYKVTIEELVQDMYAPKMQQLSQQGKLPPLVEGGSKEWIEEFIIPGNLFVDLKPWLDSKPELKARIIPAWIDYNTKGGKLFSIGGTIVRPVGLYYNATLFKPSKPTGEMTWDQFLAELGDNKIAFMTGENAWTTMLVLSALIGEQPGGADWLRAGAREARITDFNTPVMITAVTRLQAMLQNHASANTLGAAYADAANSFMSARSAVIANGSWMIGDFDASSASKWSGGFSGDDVHAGVFPGNVAVGGDGTGYNWWIPSTTSPRDQEAAKAFIEFMYSQDEIETMMLMEGGSAPRITPSPGFLAERAKNRLMDEYAGAVNKDTILTFSFEDAVPYSTSRDDFGRILPLLINGTMTPERFCEELTTKARESAR